jgi:hypothetical protein
MVATAPLEITFHGPFVFRFGINNAWAYAPECKQHYLNILTDTEDVILPHEKKPKKPKKRIRTFELTGPKPPVSPGKTTKQLGDNEIITYPWYSGKKGKGKKTGWPDTEKDWHYVLKFPAPDYIYGLVPEYVKIDGYPTKSEDNLYARALRFRYKDSDNPQFKEIDSENFHAKHLGSAELSYSIEIRYNHYHSVVRKKDEYHADARSCFKSMRKKLPPCDKWKAFFEEDPANYGVLMSLGGGTSGPHDCGAPVMALQDGVSLK